MTVRHAPLALLLLLAPLLVPRVRSRLLRLSNTQVHRVVHTGEPARVTAQA